MQTAVFVYAVMWVLFIGPLLGFNIKRVYESQPNGRKKMRWPQLIALFVVAVSITVLLSASLQSTLVSRYEIASERYARVYAEYLAGEIDKDEYIRQSNMLADPGGEENFEKWADAMALSQNGKARFQISDWIIPKYYQDSEWFPDTNVLSENNPVFVVLLFDNGSEQEYFLIRMISDETGANWKVDYAEPATEEQLKQVNYAVPSQKTGKWFTVG